MVELAADVPRPAAVQALLAANGNVRLATVMVKRKVSADEARALLQSKSMRELLQ
jgi:N-acetylmuramic acid 6-phosphate (MurNAc-6-P) etherase